MILNIQNLQTYCKHDTGMKVESAFMYTEASFTDNLTKTP